MLFLSVAMQTKPLHIISFDNPFPPNYGGVIDVFYKIKSLHQLGFEIYLHCFYDDRNEVSAELKAITKSVFLYKKNRNPLFLFSSIPLSVTSRFHKDLIRNINSVEASILFEGLQTTMILNKIKLENRKLFLRLHNLESNFYAGMSKNETSFLKKMLYYLESKKYTSYQNKIVEFDCVFTLSKMEFEYVKAKTEKVCYIPVFHGNEAFNSLSEFGNYAFYHGDLRLPDNKKAASFLIRLFQKIPDYKLIIASSNGKEFVQKQSYKTENIAFVSIEDEEHLASLLANAHINVMLSFQQAGTKLKIVNSLFKSRFCLINNNMVDDERILNLCEIANTETEFIQKINQLKNQPFTQNEEREKVLSEVYNDLNNAKKLEQILIQ
jgi:hypothetical protein